MILSKVRFKALAPILKGEKKGKLVWWEDVITDGEDVFIYTPITKQIAQLKDVKALCMFTGIYDKNLKPIYTGDIIKIEASTMRGKKEIYTTIVFYKNGSCRTTNYIGEKEILYHFDKNIIIPYSSMIEDIKDLKKECMEIVGNVFEDGIPERYKEMTEEDVVKLCRFFEEKKRIKNT